MGDYIGKCDGGFQGAYEEVRLGTPVVPLFPFYVGVSLLKLNIRKKGTPII